MQAASNPLATRRRLLNGGLDNSLSVLKANLCALFMPSSLLRLTPDKLLGGSTPLHATHRTHLSRDTCACRKCSVRQTFGDLVLPGGRRPSSVFSFLKFDGGEILQKYYTVSVHLEDALVPADPIITGGSTKQLSSSAHDQVLEIGLLERQTQPWDDLVQVNDLMHPNNAVNVARLSVAYWMVSLTLAMLICGFSACAICSVFDENRPEGAVECLPYLVTPQELHCALTTSYAVEAR